MNKDEELVELTPEDLDIDDAELDALDEIPDDELEEVEEMDETLLFERPQLEQQESLGERTLPPNYSGSAGGRSAPEATPDPAEADPALAEAAPAQSNTMAMEELTKPSDSEWGQRLRADITGRAESSEKQGKMRLYRLRLPVLLDCVANLLEQMGRNPAAAHELVEVAKMTAQLHDAERQLIRHKQKARLLEGARGGLTTDLEEAHRMRMEAEQREKELRALLQKQAGEAAQLSRESQDANVKVQEMAEFSKSLETQLTALQEERARLEQDLEDLGKLAGQSEELHGQVAQLSDEIEAGKGARDEELEQLRQERADLETLLKQVFGKLPQGAKLLKVKGGKPEELLEALKKLMERLQRLEEERRYAELLPEPSFEEASLRAARAMPQAGAEAKAKLQRIEREVTAAQTRYELLRASLEQGQGVLGDVVELSRAVHLSVAHERELNALQAE